MSSKDSPRLEPHRKRVSKYDRVRASMRSRPGRFHKVAEGLTLEQAHQLRRTIERGTGGWSTFSGEVVVSASHASDDRWDVTARHIEPGPADAAQPTGAPVVQ